MFKSYNLDNCVYECSLKNLRAINESGCVPWDIPYPFVTGTTLLCNGKEAFKFKELLTKEMQASQETCKLCRPACESTQYDIRIDTFAVDPKAACKDKDFFRALRVRLLL